MMARISGRIFEDQMNAWCNTVIAMESPLRPIPTGAFGVARQRGEMSWRWHARCSETVVGVDGREALRATK